MPTHSPLRRPTFQENALNVTLTQGKAIINMAGDLRWKAVILVALGVNWRRHVGGLCGVRWILKRSSLA